VDWPSYHGLLRKDLSANLNFRNEGGNGQVKQQVVDQWSGCHIESDPNNRKPTHKDEAVECESELGG